jgi:hypothetical protein
MTSTPGGTVEGSFHRKGDEALDVFGGESWRFGLNNHLGRGELGEDVERHLPQDQDPDDQDDDIGHDRQQPIPERGLNDPIEHAHASRAQCV